MLRRSLTFQPRPRLTSVRGLRSGCWAALALSLLTTGCSEAPANSPNVVIISLDTVSALHTGIYGYEEPTTPRLDQFARDALVFERAYTPSSHTLPAHASLMTGLYPETHGVIEMSDSLPPQATTLAERLQEKGYRTAAFERPRASELDPEIVRGLRAIGYAEE